MTPSGNQWVQTLAGRTGRRAKCPETAWQGSASRQSLAIRPSMHLPFGLGLRSICVAVCSSLPIRPADVANETSCPHSHGVEFRSIIPGRTGYPVSRDRPVSSQNTTATWASKQRGGGLVASRSSTTSPHYDAGSRSDVQFRYKTALDHEAHGCFGKSPHVISGEQDAIAADDWPC